VAVGQRREESRLDPPYYDFAAPKTFSYTLSDSGLELGLATSETQVLEHLLDAGVIGHVPAGLGVAESLAGRCIGDLHRER
jgi:hypothetical protein